MRYSVLKERVIFEFLFGVVTLFLLIHALSIPHFFTYDGPSHLYNAKLLIELIDGNSFIAQYLEFTDGFVPNYVGHLLLSIWSTITDFWSATDIILVVYMIGFPYALKYLSNQLNHRINWSLFLIFPFLYNTHFLMGFYNFYLALIPFFLGLGLVIQQVKSPSYSKLSFALTLFVLALVTLISHVFVFLMLFGSVSLVLLYYLTLNIKIDLADFRTKLLELIPIFVAFLMPLIIAIDYLFSGSASGFYYLSTDQLISMFWENRTLVMYNDTEVETVQVIGWVISISSLLVFAYSVYKMKFSRGAFSFTALSMFILLVFVVLYFLAPNSTSNAGYISGRLLFFCFIFMVLVISSVGFHRVLQIGLTVTVLWLFSSNYEYKREMLLEQNTHVEELKSIAGIVKENSIVMPFNFSNDFLHAHFSNYLGLTKSGIFVLENYEAGTGYFPLKWSSEVELEPKHRFFSECFNWPNVSHQNNKVDYIFILKGDEWKTPSQPCTKKLLTLVKDDYRTVYNSDFCSLHQLK